MPVGGGREDLMNGKTQMKSARVSRASPALMDGAEEATLRRHQDEDGDEDEGSCHLYERRQRRHRRKEEEKEEDDDDEVRGKSGLSGFSQGTYPGITPPKD